MSDSHEVHIEIVPTQHNHGNTAQFLIKYQGELSIISLFTMIGPSSPMTVSPWSVICLGDATENCVFPVSH